MWLSMVIEDCRMRAFAWTVQGSLEYIQKNAHFLLSYVLLWLGNCDF